MEFGFGEAGLERIVALADPANGGSRKVMEKCGLKYEKDIFLFGFDCVYYARNRGDEHDSRN